MKETNGKIFRTQLFQLFSMTIAEHHNSDNLGSYFPLPSSMVLLCRNHWNTPAEAENQVLTFGLPLPRKQVKLRFSTLKRRGRIYFAFSDLTHWKQILLGFENSSSKEPACSQVLWMEKRKKKKSRSSQECWTSLWLFQLLVASKCKQLSSF